jgi:hypothetical protein
MQLRFFPQWADDRFSVCQPNLLRYNGLEIIQGPVAGLTAVSNG